MGGIGFDPQIQGFLNEISSSYRDSMVSNAFSANEISNPVDHLSEFINNDFNLNGIRADNSIGNGQVGGSPVASNNVGVHVNFTV